VRLRRLQRELSQRGLDLVQPFSLAWLQPESQLPTAGLAVLVGNTRALWPPFIAALAGRESLEGSRARDGAEAVWSDRHPLNCYVRHSVFEAAQSAGLVLDEAVFDWERRAGRCLPLQRIAHVTGMAHLLQQAHLAIHPLVGPWLALRAVIVIGNATAEDAGLVADEPPEVRKGER
jgi:methylmalonic aciduria homocystinuria type C protein